MLVKPVLRLLRAPAGAREAVDMALSAGSGGGGADVDHGAVAADFDDEAQPLAKFVRVGTCGICGDVLTDHAPGEADLPASALAQDRGWSETTSCTGACGALYCHECLGTHVSHEVSGGHAAAPRCPTPACGTLGEDVLAAVLDVDAADRRARLALAEWAAAAAQSGVVVCPGADCPGVFFVDRRTAADLRGARAARDAQLRDWYFRAEPGSWLRRTLVWLGLLRARRSRFRTLADGCDARRASCGVPGCGTDWCLLCGQAWEKVVRADGVGEISVPHDARSCEEHSLGDRVSESVAWIQSHARPCPNPACRVRIEKNGGCPDMRCAKCNKQFCWTCHTLYDDNGRHVCGRPYVPPLPPALASAAPPVPPPMPFSVPRLAIGAGDSGGKQPPAPAAAAAGKRRRRKAAKSAR